MSGEIRLVTADDVCTAAQSVLETQLGALLETLGLDENPGGALKKYEPPKKWDQVPTLEALQSADFPAGAITSTGLVGELRRSSTGHDGTFQLRVGIFDRGKDYNVTAGRIRTWAALVRGLMLANPGLAGLAAGLRCVGESYRNLPQTRVARTLGGCTVDFHVDVRNIADLSALAGALPAVESTFSIVTVRPPQE